MKKDGFTLIEMLAVVILIGLLAVIIVSRVKPSIDDSREATSFASANSLIKSLEEYYFEQKMQGFFNGCFYDFKSNQNSCVGFEYTGTAPTGGVLSLSIDGNIEGNVIFYDKYDYQIVSNIVVNDIYDYDEKKYITEGTEYIFDNTNNEQTLNVEQTGYYKLEVWGAQGGNYSDTYRGGYGAYSKGKVMLYRGQILYINVGGQGCVGSNNTICGGYNGGGSAITSSSSDFAGGGGGATHIATQSGILSDLSNNNEDILIVAGGGGGIYYHSLFNSSGGDAGGVTGSLAPAGTCGDGRTLVLGRNASQLSGGGSNGCGAASITLYGSFGQGASSDSWSSGGGAGYYGGGYGFAHGANGGSSYIGNSLLTDKAMYCYNCLESDDVNTKTISTTNVSSSSISEYAKAGNGLAKITYLGK